jgi:tetratricopeptide (TPR) repeat protein
MRRPHRLIQLICATLLGVLCLCARAGELNEVNRLFRAGQTSEALERADRFLVAKPSDAQMRFLKAVMLAESKRGAQALEIFVKLTEDFPELAEPYNNLAVLYAAEGQHEKARVALETAVRNDPNYPIAQENLGDVYAFLASRAYSRAVTLDPDNVSAPPKLALIRELLSGRHRTLGGSAPAIGAPPS